MSYRAVQRSRTRLVVRIVLGTVATAGIALTAWAGDLLRGGASANTAPNGTTAASTASGTPPALAGVPSAQDQLARTTQALQAVQAMQESARQLAASAPANLGLDPNHAGLTLPNVPNGLGVGGLQVAPGVGTDSSLWQGAELPVQTDANGKTTVAITQTDPQALLEWQTFNVGKETTVSFDQSAGGANETQWIAFNKIDDPTGVPSQILGAIDAPGQVYVINPNGIIFGGTSQVNTHALVASALPINDDLVSRGLLNNPDSEFLFTPLELDANGLGTLQGPLNGRYGDVTVQAGATLTAPSSADHVGGRIALIGPNVTNAGTINTPDGQAILAAGLQVGWAAHDTNDPTLRGLDVYVGRADWGMADAPEVGLARNTGLISAPRADVTLAGRSVAQEGFIDSSTSVAFNGRIDLLANYDAVSSGGFADLPPFFSLHTGTVTLGADSVTRILPEWDSKELIVGTQLALPSRVNVQGRAVHFASNADVWAPNANVTVDAGRWNLTGSGAFAVDKFVHTEGQIYLDAGAAIDVAGSTDVSVPVTENIVAVQLRGSELADYPLQREGKLRGQTIYVDVRQTGTYNGRTWIGTPLADARGYAALIQRNVGELTTAGGTVSLSAGESVVLQSGATVNVSGGWIQYEGGYVETSKVLSGGHVYDIAQATPDRVYDGLYTATNTTSNSKWGTTDTTTNARLDPTYEAGYVQGGSAGALNITAPAMALDGTLVGQTVNGPRQRTTPAAPGRLELLFQAQYQNANNPSLFLPFSPTPPAITFADGASQTAAGAFALDANGLPMPLRADRRESVTLAPALVNEDGFGSLHVDNSDGAISLPVDVALNAPAGGSIKLDAANLDIAGTVTVPGGKLDFTVYDFSPFSPLFLDPAASTPSPDDTRGRFTLGATAALNTAGLIIDDGFSSSPTGAPFMTGGGAVTIKGYDVTLAAGSRIDVSGGMVVDATGRPTYGNGGSISIAAGQDPGIASILGGMLSLESAMAGYSGAKGGALSLLAPTIQIGGSGASPDTLQLAPDFFSQGGFTSFSLSGLGAKTSQPGDFVPGVVIAAGTSITPIVQSWVLDLGPATGSGFQLTPTVLAPGVRSPVNLAFNAPGVRDPFNSADPVVIRGSLVMENGARIEVDPKAVVSMSGDTTTVFGSVSAPGGTINVSGAKDSTLLFHVLDRPLPTVDLAPMSVLSTAGTTVYLPDPRGYHTGSVLSGGTINISGNVVAEAGATLDVSGTSGVLDLAPSYGGGSTAANTSISGSLVVPTRVDSNGGAITFSGAQELFSDATLRGAAGGPTAQGGSLNVSSGRFLPPGSSSAQTPLDVTLDVTQNAVTLPVSFYDPGETAIGHAVLDGSGQVAGGWGHFSADKFNLGGFDALTLSGTVRFTGPVNIAARRSVRLASNGVILADAPVTIGAPYVSLGTAFEAPLDPIQVHSAFLVANQPFYVSPTYGSGSLSIAATDLIDVGNLALRNIGSLSLEAAGGDIRGDGTLDVAGDLQLTAGQIYPPSAVSFTLSARDYIAGGTNHAGTISIAASGERGLPLSAGGVLNVYASQINQDGVLRAPLGTINLGWDGVGDAPRDLITGTAVAATRQLMLGPDSQTSVSAVDPLTGEDLTIPYGLNLNDASWIDPTGVDITLSGPPAKSVNLSAANVTQQSGAVIDVSGGGDMYAYRWFAGVGGSQDVLLSTGSFAILPGYAANYAPYAPFNPAPVVANFGSDPGYVNAGLKVGDQIHLEASKGLPAGTYTLLPARYALLPGAFLVTPQNGLPAGTVALPDGATLVSGFRFNDLDAGARIYAPSERFEVASSAIVRKRAEYHDSSANTFLAASAVAQNAAVPRLPLDAGQLVFTATQAMTIQGEVAAKAFTGGRGGIVDINSPVDIMIGGAGATAPAGVLALDASELSAFGAESLLIGGVRHTGSSGTSITVNTNQLTVDNAGTPLAGSDVILVANRNVTLAPGAVIQQSGADDAPSESLQFGDATKAGSGNGALVRVSGDGGAVIARTSVNDSFAPVVSVGAGAEISGASITLDSTRSMTIDPSAHLNGDAIALGSGQISLLLDNPGTLQPTAGLVLSGDAVHDLQSARALSLLSYTSIDLYGTGQVGDLDASSQPTLASLSLHAGEIRGFNHDGGAVTFAAQDLLLDNSAGALTLGAAAAADGSLNFHAGTIRIGTNSLRLDQYADVNLEASGGLLMQGTGGLLTQANLHVTTPLLTAATAADQAITAGGRFDLASAGTGSAATVAGGLGAQLSLSGTIVDLDSNIVLPSGTLSVRATRGDLQVGARDPSRLDVGGTARDFYDLTQYTDGGTISLRADAGSVNIAVAGTIAVAAAAGGGSAGTLSLEASGGDVTVAGSVHGEAGTDGQGGSFVLNVGSLANGTATLDGTLNAGGFTTSRDLRVRTGDVTVDGLVQARDYNLSADQGSITVTGVVDASGPQGGTVDLAAGGSVVLADGSRVTVAAQDFDAAGKGGAVSLEAGSLHVAADNSVSQDSSAVVDVRSGSTIDLTVASSSASDAALGRATGTLHLRAPQTAGGTDLAVNELAGTILGASSIVAEGYQYFDLTPAGGLITNGGSTQAAGGSIASGVNVQASVKANGAAFGANAGAIADRLLAANPGLASVLHVRPGAELINTNGDLTLNRDWDLSSFRFGTTNEPGVLTLRAAGNLNFDYNSLDRKFASLSDGFAGTSVYGLWDAPLMSAGTSSWSYRLVAGADLGAADFRQVRDVGDLAAGSGSIVLGRNSPILPTAVNNARQSIIPQFYQTIRTGTGDIDLHAGRDVQFLNPLATVYTAGTQAAPIDDFDLPQLNYLNATLGTTQSPVYPAQYSLAGGNVTITAGRDIAHYRAVTSGSTIQYLPDSSRELPNNWLYRRGWIDPTTGQFGASHTASEIASTTWWIDFSNFFEGVGALGGGNVNLTAGHNVTNLDAVVPTNARMPKSGVPNAASLFELGGGDLVVRAGHDIDGGVYYVERGAGTLTAGGDIRTNSTRAALTQFEVNNGAINNIVPDPTTWLPTTLFLGKGSFDLTAGGDLLLGPVANPFLLPQGINNSFYEKTYFSTYATSDEVAARSLTGAVTVKDDADLGAGSLEAWFQNVLRYDAANHNNFSNSQPWLRLVETRATPFATVAALMPASLDLTAFSGDINLVGSLTLAPSPTGTVDLAAAGSINGLQVNDADVVFKRQLWGSSTINLSDADPRRIPGVASPRSLPARTSGFNGASWANTPLDIMDTVDLLFRESGSIEGTYGIIQTKQALHAPGPLHRTDPSPVHLYAPNGDISGLTLYAGKSARVLAGRDITDIALYVQNNQADDVSVVAAGRDLVAYAPNSPLRVAAQSAGNDLLPTSNTTPGPGTGNPTAGDIQVGGPGTLEVLAGRNFDVGVGPNASDGTAVGVTTIGNARNPSLPFAGADVFVGAGLGAVAGLDASRLDFAAFVSQFLDPTTAGANATRYLTDLGKVLNLDHPTTAQVWDTFTALPDAEQHRLALAVFYHVLRDAGRDHGVPDSPGFRNYDAGFAAIKALFPGNTWDGDISLTSREIKTASGGDISLFAPGGQLVVGYDLSGNQPVDQGILTEAGGAISIFTHDSVNVGTSRIFTLRGGNEIIWSSAGNIAAGASSKTVQSAPPTRVLIDPQSADVKTDLAGLATGGGIGVLATVEGVPPGDVDLIAPVGTIDAGDAGIRVSGNLNVSALEVVNSTNIQVSGASVGTPSVTPPSLGGLATTAASAATAASSAAEEVAQRARTTGTQTQALPSIITVEVLGYGGGDGP